MSDEFLIFESYTRIQIVNNSTLNLSIVPDDDLNPYITVMNGNH